MTNPLKHWPKETVPAQGSLGAVKYAIFYEIDLGLSPGSSEHSKTNHHGVVMRQLKGKPKKETSKDKKERKQAMQEARQQVATVVLPTMAVVVLLIIVFVYVATRPDAIE